MNPTKSRRSRGARSTNRQRHFSQSRSLRHVNKRAKRPGEHSMNRGKRRPFSQGGRRKMPTFDPSKFINTNPVDVAPEVYIPKNSFETFGLDERLVKTITEMGITIPTPIQDQIIPEILAGRDVIGIAETGTGKTAAFLVPLIENTLKNHTRQTLVMAPTRELAIQIEEELRRLSRGLNLYSVICVGGVNIRPQIKALKHNNHFIIGTPGRLLDLINRKHFRTNGITTVVLDEADRMLDMGFIHDMRKILSDVSTNRQTLLFSATMPNEAKKIVHDFLKDPVTVSVKKKDVTDSIEQEIVHHGYHNKFETLQALLSKPEFKRVLIFGSMKHSVEKLSRKLTKSGVKSESIHGNKRHSQRQKSLKKFKDGQARVLVATDVAARGIHVEDVTHVINYDLPNTFEDYVHRIGRTGRVDKRGKALTFVATK